MGRLLCLVGALALLAAASGCVTFSAGTAPSTRPLAPDGYTVTSKTEGTSWGVNILGIPLCQANTAEAVAEAKKEIAADALIEVTTDNRFICLFLVNLQRVKVEALGVKTK